MLHLRPFTLAAALLAVLLGSAPAHAGRASGCKAPPFAVPRETQRAVDAAINARVVGTGAGSVSTSVETRTDYETTTLSQDAAARAWTEYSLCEKLARKLISQELHDELLRALIAPAVPTPPSVEAGALAPAAAPAPTVAAGSALTAADLVGTWQVVSRFAWSDCPAPNDTSGDYAYIWIIGTDQQGALRVDVTGTTAYPQMTGRIRGDHVVLAGLRGGGPTPRPEWTFAHPTGDSSSLFGAVSVDLRRTDGDLIGVRDVVLYQELPLSGSADRGVGVQLAPCTVRFDVHATR